MIPLHKPTLLALCSAIALLLPGVGSAQDDYDRRERRPSTRGDTAREERSTSARMSERDQRSFESFLDAHDETAQELYRNPDLVKNERFLQGHAALRDWLEDHPDAAEALRDNPRTVIWQERGTRGQERRTGDREREERRPTTGETLRDLLK
jgi:hypothetical protein